MRGRLFSTLYRIRGFHSTPSTDRAMVRYLSAFSRRSFL
ncbi:hypothetical protein DmAi_13750 [Acetobacter persici]|uniref:Uncharacterized protein n=1 Tax=Acetobacter persici TaxID=1076596 RepID=A0A6V8I9Q7_9PROT|nr:hypothetical protein DmAi_13750 [Acetobacter persici]